MEYSKLVAVSGLPGLYELINSKNDGAIIRSLEDNSTKFASSRLHNFSHLESIEIFTTRENVNLVEIFYAMEKVNTSLPDDKDNAAIKKYFEKVYPDLDFEKVYASDLKKMIKWFDILKKKNIEIKLSEPVIEEPKEEVRQVVEEKPVKKKNAVKAPAAKKEEAPKPARSEGRKKAAETKKEKPTEKKEAAKKSAAKKEEKPGKKTVPKKK